MIGIKCLDSSVWLSYYFSHNLEARKIIDGEGLILTSSLSLFEVKKRLLSLKIDSSQILALIKERSVIIMPTVNISEKAAEIAMQKKLGAIDSLIYTTSQMHNAELVSGDNDFRDLENVKIIS